MRDCVWRKDLHLFNPVFLLSLATCVIRFVALGWDDAVPVDIADVAKRIKAGFARGRCEEFAAVGIDSHGFHIAPLLQSQTARKFSEIRLRRIADEHSEIHRNYRQA